MESITDSNWTRWTQLEPVPKFPQFWFEKVDIDFWYDIAEKYMISLIISTIILYHVAVWELKKFMRNRKPFESLRLALFVWNSLVAILSGTVVLRVYQELLFELNQPNGFYRSLCIREGLHMSTLFWAVVCTWFRPLFILDTVFLILRQKPVGNFHLLHHTLSIIFTPLLLVTGEPLARYLGLANLSVHAIDYNILALKSLKIPVPKSNQIMIGLEVFQMAFALVLSSYTVYLKETSYCLRHPGSVMLTYFVYAVLLIAVTINFLVPKITTNVISGKITNSSVKNRKSN